MRKGLRGSCHWSSTTCNSRPLLLLVSLFNFLDFGCVWGLWLLCLLLCSNVTNIYHSLTVKHYNQLKFAIKMPFPDLNSKWKKEAGGHLHLLALGRSSFRWAREITWCSNPAARHWLWASDQAFLRTRVSQSFVYNDLSVAHIVQKN